MAQPARKKIENQRPRRRQPRITSRKPVEEKSTFAHEAAAFVLAAFGVFLLCAIYSHINTLYQEIDPSPALLAKTNSMGFVGYRVANILFRALGWCSLLTVVWSWLLARSVWKKIYKSSMSAFVRSTAGLAIMAISAATIAALYYDSEGGGALGLRISSLLLPYLNRGGTVLLCGFILTMALVASTGVRFAELLGLATSTSKHISKGAAVGVKTTSLVGSKALQLQVGVTKRLASATADAVRKSRERHDSLGRSWELDTEDQSFVLGKDHDGPPIPPVAPVSPAATTSSFSATAKIIPLLPAPEYSGESDEAEDGDDSRPSISLRDRIKRKKKLEALRKSPRKENFALPPLELLKKPEPSEKNHPKDDELLKNCKQLERALADFKVNGKIIEVQPGPVITLYEFEPAPGVKVSRVVTLADDLALALKVASVRVYAPVPGKGTVGIEVPNSRREIVLLREILDSKAFRKEEASLALALGKDTFGEPFATDLAEMPHLLIAGATGTGKSVCINSLLLSLLYRNTPQELRLIMIDPKMLELSVYEKIPHLKAPVVTNPKRARGALWWAVEEMERRYHLMMDLGVRNLDGYNRRIEEGGPMAATRKASAENPSEFAGEVLTTLPRIVIVVDELADLMLTVGREVEELITRLAQKARAAGIHLILATQRPSVNVITGLIKANFPSRISFKVASRIDARTVLDGSGAERLLGQGDMLFISNGAGRPKRLHGAFVADAEVHEVVNWWRSQGAPDYDPQIDEMIKKLNEADKDSGMFAPDAELEHDPLYDQALQLVVEKGQASTSMIQRVFRIGYNRAARILEMMEREGVVGPADGAKPRQILAPRHIS